MSAVAHQVDELATSMRRRVRDEGLNFATSLGPLLAEAVELLEPRSILEIGGGRSPHFLKPENVLPEGTVVVTNDISADELALLPPTERTSHFDICGQVPDEQVGCHDLVFSRSVLEHVSSGDRAISNSLRLLRPGGVAIHTYPTLYALPFVANRLIPWRISDRVYRTSRYKRFPAHYSGCTSTDRRLREVEGLGESGKVTARVVRFWEHAYYDSVPVVGGALSAMHHGWARFAAERDLAVASTYCHLIIGLDG